MANDDQPTVPFPKLDMPRWEPLQPTRLDVQITYPARPRGRHRKEGPAVTRLSKDARTSPRKRKPISWLSLTLAAVAWALVIPNAMGLTPGWVFWSAFTLYALRVLWLYARPAAWRTEDPRRVAGDARGEAHRKADHADTRPAPSWADPNA